MSIQQTRASNRRNVAARVESSEVALAVTLGTFEGVVLSKATANRVLVCLREMRDFRGALSGGNEAGRWLVTVFEHALAEQPSRGRV